MTIGQKILAGSLGLVAVVCGGAGIFASRYVDFLGASNELPRAEAQARAAGVPFSASDLDRMPPLPVERNSFEIFKDLEGDADLEFVSKTYSDASNGRASFATLETAVVSNRPLVEKCRQAASLDGLDPGHDFDMGPVLELPELATTKSVAKVLCASARINATKGDFNRAAQDIGLARRLGRQIAEFPILISAMVQCTIETVAMREIEACLALAADSKAGIDVLRSDALQEEPTFDLERILDGEAYMGIASLRNLEALGGLAGIASAAGGGPMPTLSPANVKRSGNPSDIPARAFLTRFLDYHIKLRKHLRQHPGQLLEFGKFTDSQSEVEEKEPGFSHMFCKAMAPVYTSATTSFVASQANYRCKLALATVMEWRLAHGSFPKSLKEAGLNLVDPFSGGPLSFHHTDKSCRIYSVGPNLKDDGGLTVAETSRDRRNDYDVVASFPPVKFGSKPR